MRILYIFLGFLLCFNLAKANFIEIQNYQKDLAVLTNLDIDINYIKNTNFLKVKNNNSKAYQNHLNSTFNEQRKIIPLLQDLLKEQNIPEEILYLAVVESGLNNNIISKKGAVGIWQLMPDTAKAMGLQVDDSIDERINPITSTKAATKYLTKLKENFGKWYLAILAYNCGETKLRNAIKEANSDDLHILLDPIKQYLAKETRFFLYKILLTAQMANDLNNKKYDDFQIFKNTNLANFNMKNFSLQGKISQYTKFKKNKNYIAKKGDTLISISKQFSIPIRTLIQTNNINNNKLEIGDKIVISD